MTARVEDDDDFVLVADPRSSFREPRPGAGRVTTSRRWAWLAVLTRRPARTIAGALISALVTGIVVNALVLQKEKHPAPLFVPTETHAQPTPAAPPHLGFESAPVEAKPKDPIAALLKSPADKPVSAEAPAVPKPKDPIAALLKGNAAEKPRGEADHPEVKPKDGIAALIKGNAADAAVPPAQRVAAAQNALVRLGFVLRSDGVFGAATRQAIELFERDHAMPIDGDLSPRVVRQLSDLSGISIP